MSFKNDSVLLNFLSRHAVFFTIIILTVIFSYPYREGIHPCDPGDYCKCAVQFLEGNLDFNNFYCNRVGSWLPIAMAVKVFGFQGYLLSWVTTFELLLLITVLYLSLRKYSKGISLITCSIIGFSPLMLLFSGGLWGDIMAALTANLCILWIWHVRFIAINPKQIFAGILLTLMWYFAIITKESAFYYLLPIAIIFIGDMRTRQFSQFWKAAIAAGIALGALILLAYALKTDDLFHRLQLLEHGPNIHSYVGTTWKILLARLTILPLKFIIGNFSFYVVFLPGIIHLLSKPENNKENFLRLYMFSLLFLWWFGTQSFSSWKPVLLLDRLWLPLMIPMAINAAHLFYSIIRGNAERYSTIPTKIILIITGLLIIIFGLQSRESFNYEGSSEFIFDRMIVLIFLFLTILHKNLIPSLLGRINSRLKSAPVYDYAIILLVLLAFVYNTRYSLTKNPRDNNYLADKEMIETVLKLEGDPVIISENCVSKNHGIYYGFDFATDQRIGFINWNNIGMSEITELAKQRQVFLLINKDRTQWYARLTDSQLKHYNPLDGVPSYVTSPGANWEKVKDNPRTVMYRFRSELL